MGVIGNVSVAVNMFPMIGSNAHVHASVAHNSCETTNFSEMGPSVHTNLSGIPPNSGLNSNPSCSSPPVPPLSPSSHRNLMCSIHGPSTGRKSHGGHQTSTGTSVTSGKHSTPGLFHRLTGGARSRTKP